MGKPKPKKKNGHFIVGRVLEDDGHVRITKSERFVVGGGTKESHERAADFVHEIDKEMVKNPPETPGELRMIVADAAKKAGLPAPDPKKKS